MNFCSFLINFRFIENDENISSFYNAVINKYQDSNYNYAGLSNTAIESSNYNDVLLDKVYTFRTGKHNLNISDLYFIKGYRYNIKLAIVTENHECNLDINLTDPKGNEYYIFSTNGEELAYNNYREIPFGAAKTGNYSVNFTKLDGPNLNIHIKILRDEFCHKLFDAGDNLIWIDIITISSSDPPTEGIALQKYLYLLSQRKYNIYISRVSPVRIDYPNSVYLDHNVVDPSEEHISFPIYDNELMKGLFEEDQYHFGTSIHGEYLFNFTFYPAMEHTNILLFVVDEGQIASGQEPFPLNLSEFIPINIEGPKIGPSVSMPLEAQIGLGIGIGSLIIIGLAIAVYIKHKSNL